MHYSHRYKKYKSLKNDNPHSSDKIILRWIMGRIIYYSAYSVRLLSFFNIVLLFSLFFSYSSIQAQEKTFQRDDYILSEEEKILTIVVHIWGEVNRPGEYRVRDGTNILELISKAGGPTKYSNLNNVILTRRNIESVSSYQFSSDSLRLSDYENMTIPSKPEKVTKLNLRKYLNGEKEIAPFVLQPGDVVRVKENMWYKWQSVIRVISQIAIFIQAWYWFSRID